MTLSPKVVCAARACYERRTSPLFSRLISSAVTEAAKKSAARRAETVMACSVMNTPETPELGPCESPKSPPRLCL